MSITARYFFALFALTFTCSAFGRGIELLRGEVSLDVPAALEATAPPSAVHGSNNYDVIAYFSSADRRVSVEATYGKHYVDPKELPAFLDQKIAEYSTLDAKLPHFRWLSHSIVERGGQQYADISFAHGHKNTTKTEAYTRCISCIVGRHLLEIWVVTHRMPNPADKKLVPHRELYPYASKLI